MGSFSGSSQLVGAKGHRNRVAMPCSECCDRGVHNMFRSMVIGEGDQGRHHGEGNH